MKTTLSVILLTAALAGPAAAEEIRISLVDKDPSTVRAEIIQAADTVCSTAFREGEIEVQEMIQCPSMLSADAMAQASAYRPANSTASGGSVASTSVGSLASNSLAPAGSSK